MTSAPFNCLVIWLWLHGFVVCSGEANKLQKQVQWLTTSGFWPKSLQITGELVVLPLSLPHTLKAFSPKMTCPRSTGLPFSCEFKVASTLFCVNLMRTATFLTSSDRAMFHALRESGWRSGLKMSTQLSELATLPEPQLMVTSQTHCTKPQPMWPGGWVAGSLKNWV